MSTRKNPGIAPPVFYETQNCPIRSIMAGLSGKWSLLILSHLSFGTHRFSELLGGIPDISQRMLTQTLRSLERDGMVERTVTPSIPPRVDYRLTHAGESLLDHLNTMIEWSLRNKHQIEACRADYDAVLREKERKTAQKNTPDMKQAG